MVSDAIKIVSGCLTETQSLTSKQATGTRSALGWAVSVDTKRHKTTQEKGGNDIRVDKRDPVRS